MTKGFFKIKKWSGIKGALPEFGVLFKFHYSIKVKSLAENVG